jgi:predicted transposase YdaD
MDFWDKLSPEEITMLGKEWDWNIAMEVEREESYDKGLEDGIEKAARNALAEGFSVETVQKITGLDAETIKKLQGT